MQLDIHPNFETASQKINFLQIVNEIWYLLLTTLKSIL